MHRFPALLLSTVFSASLAANALGDEQVRKLQEELRKRHLFYGNTNGEFSPALTAAIAHYQKKKGFALTGLIDRETRESLGIPDLAPQIAPTPFVVARAGDVRGMNGESLPNSTPLFASANGGSTWTDQKPLDVADIAQPPSEGVEERIQSPDSAKQRPRPRFPQRPPPPKETNPLMLAYHSMNHAWRWGFGDAQQQQKKKRSPVRHS